MNIHPIFVHFPIALLTTYAVLELIRFHRILNQTYWFYLKAVLVILGASAGWVTLQTGDMVKHLVTDRSLYPLINTHEFWAKASVAIFSILAAGYLVAWVKRSNWVWVKKLPIIWNLAVWLQVLIVDTPLVMLLALAGLAALLVTGALGGSIVYGHQGDPFTNWIYGLFFKP